MYRPLFVVGAAALLILCGLPPAFAAGDENAAVEVVLSPAVAAEDEDSVSTEEEAVEEEEEDSSGVFGYLYLQGTGGETSYGQDGSEGYRDLGLYWGELGYYTAAGDWSANFSVLLNDRGPDVYLHEAWVMHQRLDSESGEAEPWFFKAGRQVLPFGNNPSYFPTYPAVNDLGYSTLPALGICYDDGRGGLGLYAYSAPLSSEGEGRRSNGYSAVWNIARREPAEGIDGYALSLGYNSNLAAHDLQLAGTEVGSEVEALNVFGRYDFSLGCDDAMLHLLADYTFALDDYSPAELDANGDGFGDSPAAFNTELVYEPRADRLFGLSWQHTGELADYAESRFGLLYGERLNDVTALRLEYTRGEYGSYVSEGQLRDDTFVAELSVEF